jgi:succinate dehydrogenase/fumarate reductase flavoprotein subunit
MATPSSSYDVVILGSGIAGLTGALAAQELGLQPVVGGDARGGTVHSYELIWVGQNYLARNAGIADSHDEVIAYMRFLGGGAVDEARLTAFVARSPEVLKFFVDCGIILSAGDRPTVPIALQGTGGIGKTQLAVRYCQTRHYPGGILWLNMASPAVAVIDCSDATQHADYKDQQHNQQPSPSLVPHHPLNRLPSSSV